MIQESDIITCESYKGICDYIYSPDNLSPESGIVHVNMEELLAFFSAISNYPDRKYVVVSSCSDFGLSYQEMNPVWADMSKWARMMATPELEYKQACLSPRCDIDRCKLTDLYSVKCYAYTAYTFNKIPDNVVHWYMTSARISPESEPRITIIPFGVAPNSAKDIMEVAEETQGKKVDSKIYINWVNYTVDRLEIKENYRLQKAYLRREDVVIVDEAKPYKDYLRDLYNYHLILSPEGNGVDCYRNLEALYVGAFPIMMPNHVSINLSDLPIGISPFLTGLYAKDLLNSYLVMKAKSMDKAKLSYWKEKFNDSLRSLTV